MKITHTKFEGLIVLEPYSMIDERGHFVEAYNYESFKRIGVSMQFVQDNQSYSKAGVVRGLHFQNSPKAQTKLVRVVQGAIWDVVVDLRADQPTFGISFGIELSREKGNQLLVPKGFAHGFSVLGDFADVLYKCDEFYSPEHESGINISDPDLKIDWKIPANAQIVSTKDKLLPFLKDSHVKF